MTAEILAALLRANLAAGAAVLLVLAVRAPVRRRFGVDAAYRLWLLAPLLAAASLLPFPAGQGWREAAIIIPPALTAPAAPVRAADAELPLVWLWLAGALACAALLAYRQQRFVRALGRLERVQGPRPALRRAQHGDVGPAVVGSTIVIPADFEARYTPPEREAVLAHEHAHLARRDPATNALAAAAQCLCWFNPLVHVAATELRLDQELACDAAVIRARPELRRAYAEALLKTQFAASVPPVGCTWPARASHPLKERIKMLKSLPPTRRRSALGGALFAVVALGGGYVAWAAQPEFIAPDWVQRPTGYDMVRFYPAEAQKTRTEGEVLMQCRVETAGTLSACGVLRETPPGAGFGDAVLQMAPLFRMKPASRDGKPVAGAMVRIPVAFRLAPEPAPPAAAN